MLAALALLVPALRSDQAWPRAAAPAVPAAAPDCPPGSGRRTATRRRTDDADATDADAHDEAGYRGADPEPTPARRCRRPARTPGPWPGSAAACCWSVRSSRSGPRPSRRPSPFPRPEVQRSAPNTPSPVRYPRGAPPRRGRSLAGGCPAAFGEEPRAPFRFAGLTRDPLLSASALRHSGSAGLSSAQSAQLTRTGSGCSVTPNRSRTPSRISRARSSRAAVLPVAAVGQRQRVLAGDRHPARPP